MTKKIMVLTGSPRNDGNTNTIARWITDGAKEASASVNLIDVTKLKSISNGCLACMGCQKNEKFECLLDDEVKQVLASIPQMDVLVFATPTYFYGPSAQIKTVMDRMYSLIKFDSNGQLIHNLKLNKMSLIATAGGGIQGLQLIENTFKIIAGTIGIEFSSMLVPNTYSDEIKQNHELQERAKAYGHKLAS